MKNKNVKPSSASSLIGITIFLLFLTILFGFNVYIAIPKAPVNLAEYYDSDPYLSETAHINYELRADQYTVLPSFSSIHQSTNSTFRWLSNKEFKYYIATVNTPNGNTFTTPIRAVGKKAESLDQGIPVDLYGMRGNMDDEVSISFWSNVSLYDIVPDERCLHDNNDTVLKSAGRMVIFGALTVGCIVLMIYMHKRQANLRKLEREREL